MKNKLLKTIFVITIVGVAGYNVYQSQEEVSLSALNLANIEALARGEEGGTTHTLECGCSGVKMCEATCGRCNVTLKAWGNDKSAKLTCSAH